MSAQSAQERARVAQVKSWAREALGDEPTVLVTELHCKKVECPSVETVLAAFTRGGQRRWTVAAPLAEVTRAQILAAIAERPQGDGSGGSAP